MDTVFIEQLEIQTLIGVFDWERTAKRSLFLDIELGWDFSKASKSDDVKDTLDYAAVCESVTQFADTCEFLLLEALIEAIADKIINDFSVPWLKITMHKPGIIANAKNVGVQIERGSHT